MRQSKEKLVLSADGQVKACWNRYDDSFYLNIRRYVEDDIATQCGVTLNLPEWVQLKSWLTDSSEVRLLMKAYAELLRTKARQELKATCTGCSVQHGSQRSHECIMAKDVEAVAAYVQNHGWMMRRAEVVLEAAKLAVQKGMTLCRPRECLLLIEELKKDELISMAGRDTEDMVIAEL